MEDPNLDIQTSSLPRVFPVYVSEDKTNYSDYHAGHTGDYGD